MQLFATRLLPFTSLVALCIACGGSVEQTPSGDGGGQDGAMTFQDGNQGAQADSSCGGGVLPLQATQPNMLIVFDRSCSMRRLFDDSGTFGTGPNDPASRWYVARQAVSALMQRFETRMRFGLMVFPRPKQACEDIPQASVACDLLNRQPVLDALDAPNVQPYALCDLPETDPNYQAHVTPTDEALRGAMADPALADTSRARYVLLITDGHATCGATSTSLGATSAQLFATGVKTAVVGFGDADGETAIGMLNAVASEGGLPRINAPQQYWLATDAAGLSSALEKIAAEALSCRFKLKESPPDADKLYTYADGVELTRGDADGWTYDATEESITLQGLSCAKLKSGELKQLSVVYGCPAPACQPTPEYCDGLDNDCNGLVDDGCLK